MITFGSGSLSGYFVEDVCTMGDPEDAANQLSLENFQFGLVTEQTVFSGNFDAIIGLAYPSMAEKGLTPFFDEIMEEEILKDNLFAFFMSMNPAEEESDLTLGYYDKNHYTGKMNWHDVRDKLFFSLSLEDIKLNGESLGICNGEKKCLMTPDSGTSAMTMPTWAFDEFKSKVDAPGPCAEGAEFEGGDLTLTIDGIDYPIASNHWMEREVNENELGGSCKHYFSKLDILQEGQENLFIIGATFMQLYYTVFDRDNDRVGLAKAKHTKNEVVMQFDSKRRYVGQKEV